MKPIPKIFFSRHDYNPLTGVAFIYLSTYEDVPQPPENVKAVNVGKNVKVTFQPGFNSYSPIQTYTVQFAVIDPDDKVS